MDRRNTAVSSEQLRLLMESLGVELLKDKQNINRVLNLLSEETVKFRDKLKQETGAVLTVGDTRIALEGLEKHLEGQALPRDLSPEQKALVRIWIDRLEVFGGH
ncbi:MAG: hypothetical protein GY867_02085 [bacterium]|nr:hypothetical protein [bacterium]